MQIYISIYHINLIIILYFDKYIITYNFILNILYNLNILHNTNYLK